MKKYWETETPEVIETPKNVIRFYRDAEKLSIARPTWTDKDGAERQGKTVTLDVAALLESEAGVMSAARDVFAEIARSIDERLELTGGH